MTDYGQQGPFSRGDKLLEQYVVTRLLGTGGHAYVYECRDLFLDELLAIKVIPNPPNRGRDLLNRARAEAQLLRRLSHPNVVRMHTAAAVGEDMVCLVMEKLEGVTLRHLLALLGRLSLVEAATVVRQAAIGIAAAHDLNVVHRDIKPDNVFVLPPNNHVKVLDFGIAKFLGHGLQTSNKYRFQGTPLYMSPEHLKGSGVTVRSDVYQLGTVLFELIAGINPNLIDVANPGFEQIAFVQITRPTPSLVGLVPNLPAGLDALVQQATAKVPEERFRTMSEFVDHLDRLMQVHCAEFPTEVNRIRFVDASLVQAARELAAREGDVSCDMPANAFAPTEPYDRASNFIGAEAARKEIGSPRPYELASISAKVASFHPVPNSVAQAQVPIPRAARVPNLAPSQSARPPQSLSARFVLLALASGVLIGVLLLWLMPRRVAVPPTTNAIGGTSTSTAPPTASVQVPIEMPVTAAPVQGLSGPVARNSTDHRAIVETSPSTPASSNPLPDPPSSAVEAVPAPTQPATPPHGRPRELTGKLADEDAAEGK